MTELLRRAGIIPRHISELEKWRVLDQKDEGKSAEQMVEDLVGDIESLLESEPVMKQTVLSAIHVKEPERHYWIEELGKFTAAKDDFGRLVVDPNLAVEVGHLVESVDEESRVVLEVDLLYEGDKVIAKMLKVE